MFLPPVRIVDGTGRQMHVQPLATRGGCYCGRRGCSPLRVPSLPASLSPRPLCQRGRKHSKSSIEVQFLPFCKLQNKFELLPSTVGSSSKVFSKRLPVVVPVSILVCSKSKYIDLGNETRNCSLSQRTSQCHRVMSFAPTRRVHNVSVSMCNRVEKD